MIRKVAALLALLAVLVTGPAAAYREYGHETVAAIAWRNVRPGTRAAIERLLRRQALLEAMIRRLVPAARLQVERGGMRLARLLDEALV